MKAGICRRRGTLDVLGGGISLLCALHCLLLPILLPVSVAFFHNLWLEVGFMAAALFVGGFALSHGYKKHGFRAPALLFLLGMSLIAAGNWLLTGGNPLSTLTAQEHSHAAASFVTVGIGALLIVTAHTSNFLLERRLRPLPAERDAEVGVHRQVV